MSSRDCSRHRIADLQYALDAFFESSRLQGLHKAEKQGMELKIMPYCPIDAVPSLKVSFESAYRRLQACLLPFQSEDAADMVANFDRQPIPINGLHRDSRNSPKCKVPWYCCQLVKGTPAKVGKHMLMRQPSCRLERADRNIILPLLPPFVGVAKAAIFAGSLQVFKPPAFGSAQI